MTPSNLISVANYNNKIRFLLRIIQIIMRSHDDDTFYIYRILVTSNTNRILPCGKVSQSVFQDWGSNLALGVDETFSKNEFSREL